MHVRNTVALCFLPAGPEVVQQTQMHMTEHIVFRVDLKACMQVTNMAVSYSLPAGQGTMYSTPNEKNM